MTRRRIIFGAASLALLALSLLWLIPRGGGDVSKVQIGFAGYEMMNGERNLVLIVTNGSSYRITLPSVICQLKGYSSGPGVMYIVYDASPFSCSFPSIRPTGSKWGLWPSVAPGATFRFTIPVPDKEYTWRVTMSFATITFVNRLPYVFASHWPSSRRKAPISFEVTTPDIAPAATSSASTFE